MTSNDITTTLTATTSTETETDTATAKANASETAQQLRLLDASDLPLQHRLDLDTRQRGLAHVARIRRLLAEQAARRAA